MARKREIQSDTLRRFHDSVAVRRAMDSEGKVVKNVEVKVVEQTKKETENAGR
jgi:hypothetical protein